MNTNLQTQLIFSVKPMATAMAKAHCASYAIYCREWRAMGLEGFGRTK
ncbi:MAG: hypothetical protein HYZ83_00275 [Candidatus Omnitrophica bacterium]|nr:hypothetical protein [Candidatus Omnitrophota bacterium]